jgi:hypothetical protein
MIRHRHARVLVAAVALAITAALSAAPVVVHSESPVLLSRGPERCC